MIDSNNDFKILNSEVQLSQQWQQKLKTLHFCFRIYASS